MLCVGHTMVSGTWGNRAVAQGLFLADEHNVKLKFPSSPGLCDDFWSDICWSTTHSVQRPLHYCGQAKVPQFQRLGAIWILKHLRRTHTGLKTSEQIDS